MNDLRQYFYKSGNYDKFTSINQELCWINSSYGAILGNQVVLNDSYIDQNKISDIEIRKAKEVSFINSPTILTRIKFNTLESIQNIIIEQDLQT
jgi:hypothetical protein